MTDVNDGLIAWMASGDSKRHDAKNCYCGSTDGNHAIGYPCNKDFWSLLDLDPFVLSMKPPFTAQEMSSEFAKRHPGIKGVTEDFAEGQLKFMQETGQIRRGPDGYYPVNKQ